MSDAQQPATAITKIDEAVEKIREVRDRLDEMRLWLRGNGEHDRVREIEILDDKLHDALAALGQ